MKIKIHRGLDQIGGCITEIWTDSSRVFIDFGQNLPGNGKTATPEEDTLMVADIIGNNEKEHQAVFYTHAHEDHAGLSGISHLNSILAKEVRNSCLSNIIHFWRDTNWKKVRAISCRYPIGKQNNQKRAIAQQRLS